jgi:hypothetical protein
MRKARKRNSNPIPYNDRSPFLTLIRSLISYDDVTDEKKIFLESLPRNQFATTGIPCYRRHQGISKIYYL